MPERKKINKKKMSDGIRTRKKPAATNPRKPRGEIRPKTLDQKTKPVSSRNIKEGTLERRQKKLTSQRETFTKKKSGEMGVYRKRPSAGGRKKNRFSYTVLLKPLLFILLYGSALFMVFSYFDHTDVVVYPKTHTLKLNEHITAHLHPNYKQLGVNIIALSDTREEELLAQEVVPVKEKARGTIKIFNNYSTEPQRLAPHTRFRSVSGKVFLLGDKGIVVPGKTATGPGTIETVVTAQKPGAEYNIDITDFTLPGFKEAGLNQKYQDIYALSTQEFAGGFIGVKKKLSENDKKKAELRLQQELRERLTQRLLVEKTNKVILVEGSERFLFDELELQNLSTSQVRMRLRGSIFALLVEKKQLEHYLRTTYTPTTHRSDNTLESFSGISFVLPKNQSLDFENFKKTNLLMKLDGRLVWKVDDFFKKSIRGVEKKDLPRLLREFEELEKVQIQIRPFWQSHVSRSLDNISVDPLVKSGF